MANGLPGQNHGRFRNIIDLENLRADKELEGMGTESYVKEVGSGTGIDVEPGDWGAGVEGWVEGKKKCDLWTKETSDSGTEETGDTGADKETEGSRMGTRTYVKE